MLGSRGSPSIGTKYPELGEQLYRMQHRQLPEGWDKDLPAFPADAKGLATRDSSGKVLNAVAKNSPLADRAARQTWRLPPRRG